MGFRDDMDTVHEGLRVWGLGMTWILSTRGLELLLPCTPSPQPSTCRHPPSTHPPPHSSPYYT